MLFFQIYIRKIKLIYRKLIQVHTQTKTTQFVDEEGRIVSLDTVKSGTNATLFYTKTDDDMVLSKVVVNTTPEPNIEKKVRTTTETELRR